MDLLVSPALQDQDVREWVNHPVLGKVIASIKDGTWREKFGFDNYKRGIFNYCEVKEDGFKNQNFYSEALMVMIGKFGTFEDWKDLVDVWAKTAADSSHLYPLVDFRKDLMSYVFDYLDARRIEYLLSPSLGLSFDIEVTYKGVIECYNEDKSIPRVCLQSKNLSFYEPQGSIFRLSILESGKKEHLRVWFEMLHELIANGKEHLGLSMYEEGGLIGRGDCMFSEYKKMFGK